MHIFINFGNINMYLNISMNLAAGFQFIVLLLLFGSINYLMMLRRYENDFKKRKDAQVKAISKLYPKNTFVKI
mgnify:FL=1